MTKFLANENFPLLSIKFLREIGHNVVSVLQEMPGAEDREVLGRARAEGRIILTFDRERGRIRQRPLPKIG